MRCQIAGRSLTLNGTARSNMAFPERASSPLPSTPPPRLTLLQVPSKSHPDESALCISEVAFLQRLLSGAVFIPRFLAAEYPHAAEQAVDEGRVLTGFVSGAIEATRCLFQSESQMQGGKPDLI